MDTYIKLRRQSITKFGVQIMSEELDEKRKVAKRKLIQFLENKEKINEDELVPLLASVNPIDYDLIRKRISEKLEIRIKTLDSEIEKFRAEQLIKEVKPKIVEELEPWNEHVDGQQIANHIKKMILDRIILDEELATAITLWIIYTYLFDNFFISPLLTITSPEKRCGKTRVLTIIGSLVNRVISSSNISPASIYRAIEEYKPTLVIDEGDTFLTGSTSEVTGIINSGYTKSNAYVIRNVSSGNDYLPTKFSTWAPKAIAYIDSKKLPSTIEDRSIEIPLRRKKIGETVLPLEKDFQNLMKDNRRKLKRWSNENEEVLKVNIKVPEGLNDRQADNWQPLLAIADCLGSDWKRLAEKSCLHIASLADQEEPSESILLLSDINVIFEKAGFPKFLWTKNIIRELEKIEEHPWDDMFLSARKLAQMLKTFGIKSSQIREGATNKRGYYLHEFKETFERYIPPK